MPCTWLIEPDLENGMVELKITDAIDGREYTVIFPPDEARRFAELVTEIAKTTAEFIYGSDRTKAEIMRQKAAALVAEADRLAPSPPPAPAKRSFFR